MLAYSYIRFSSAIQARGKSFERQVEASQRFCSEHGLTLVENYSDLGVSAFKSLNKERINGLGRFLEAVRSGKIESGAWLIVESLDRLSREDVTKAFTDFSEMLSYDLTIVTLQDNQIYTRERVNNDVGSLFTSLGIMFKANRESKDKSLRIGDAKARIRKEAREGKRIITKVCPSWLKARDDYKGFEVIASKAETVNLIFNLVLKGWGVLAITRHLNQKQIPSISNSGVWKAVYVKKLLKNSAVYGQYKFKRTRENNEVIEVIDNYFPLVIDKDVFEQVQFLQSQRNKGGGRKSPAFKNLFQHLLVCAECGSPLHFHSHGNDNKEYIMCSSSKQNQGCNQERFLYKALEASVLKMLDEINIENFINSGNEKIQKIEMELQALQALQNRDTSKIQSFEQELSKPDFEIETLQIINNSIKSLKASMNQRNTAIQGLRKDLQDIQPSRSTSGFASFIRLRERFKAANISERCELRQEFNNHLRSILLNIAIKSYDKALIKPDLPELINSQTNEAKLQKKHNTTQHREALARLESTASIAINFKSSKNLIINFHSKYFEGFTYSAAYTSKETCNEVLFLTGLELADKPASKPYQALQQFMNSEFDCFMNEIDKKRGLK